MKIKDILLIAIGILFGSISVYALTVNSKNVIYTPEDTEWNVSDVEDALNDLFIKSKSSKNIIPKQIIIYRQGAYSNIHENNAKYIKFVYSWNAVSDERYPTNCCIAGSNDLKNWTNVFVGTASVNAYTSTEQRVDVSNYKYLSFYSNTNGQNYIEKCVISNISFE